jgi:hypothetical protein
MKQTPDLRSCLVPGIRVPSATSKHPEADMTPRARKPLHFSRLLQHAHLPRRMFLVFGGAFLAQS